MDTTIETVESSGGCQVVARGKHRNGSPRFWCVEHRRASSAPTVCLSVGARTVHTRIDVDSYAGGVGVWAALPPIVDTAHKNIDPGSLSGGVHIHARLTSDGPKVVDCSFDTVTLTRHGEPDLILEGGTLQAALTASVLGVETTLLNCKHCGLFHSDEGLFAFTPHRRHECQRCGRFFTEKTRQISTIPTPTRTVQRSVKEVELIPEMFTVGIRLWGSNPAFVWSANRHEESGVHVHTHTRQGDLVLNDTYGTVHFRGVTINPTEVTLLMVQRTVPGLTNKIVVVRCVGCGTNICDTGLAAVTPSLSHLCQLCSTVTITRQPSVSNPAVVLTDRYRFVALTRNPEPGTM